MFVWASIRNIERSIFLVELYPSSTSYGPLALDSAVVWKISKFLSWDNSNASKTTPKFFSNFFSTNMVARGVLLLTRRPYWPTDFKINLTQTYDEQMLKISSQYLERFQNYCHLTKKFWQFVKCHFYLYPNHISQ